MANHNTDYNVPPFSEAARVELEKHRQKLAADNERIQIEYNAQNEKIRVKLENNAKLEEIRHNNITKQDFIDHLSAIVLFSALPIGAIFCGIISIIEKCGK